MADVQPILRPTPGILTSDRIVVQAFQDADANAVYDAVTESVAHLRPWLPWYDTHRSVDDTLTYIRHTQAEYVLRQAFQMGIFSPSGRYLGGCALHAQDWTVPSFMIGYWIRQSEEGKGYVTEAVRLLMREAFEHLGAERLSLHCDARNTRSAGVAERVGFVREGKARHMMRDTSGALADILYYALLRDEHGEFPR